MQTRDDFAQALAQRLWETEDGIDRTLAQIAELTAFMAVGRIDAGVSAVVGQEALTGVAQAIGRLNEARAELVQTHMRLAKDARRMGMQWSPRAGGPIAKPDEDGPLRPTGRVLQRVA